MSVHLLQYTWVACELQASDRKACHRSEQNEHHQASRCHSWSRENPLSDMQRANLFTRRDSPAMCNGTGRRTQSNTAAKCQAGRCQKSETHSAGAQEEVP